MSRIVIDDSYKTEFGDCLSIKFLAEEIAKRVLKGDVIFISINFRFKDKLRQEQCGLELLIWLRLNGLMNHCVLFSFESLHALLNRSPKYLVATSIGTSFLRMPINIKSFNYLHLSSQCARIENLKENLRPAFNIDYYRHSEANWWGILVQWKIHQYVNPDFHIPYPKIVNEKNFELNSSVAKFVYLKKYSLKQKDFKEVEKFQLKIKDKKPKILQIDDQAEDGWAEINQHIIYGKVDSNLYKYIQITESDTIDSIFKKVKEILEPRVKGNYLFIPDLILLDVRLLPKRDEAINKVADLSGSQILGKLRKEFIGIPIIITTASNKVWTYQELIKLGADAYWIKEGIDESKSTEDSFRNYEQFLKVISNVLSDEYLLLKSMAERSDVLSSKKFWWENKNWGIGDIEVKGKQEKINKMTVVRKDELRKIYLDGIELYREFLTTKLHNQGYKLSFNNDWFYYSSIILHLGKIIELVHNLYTKDFGKYGSFSYVLLTRKDRLGKSIYDKRNSAAHLGKSKSIGFKNLDEFIWELNKYLDI